MPGGAGKPEILFQQGQPGTTGAGQFPATTTGGTGTPAPNTGVNPAAGVGNPARPVPPSATIPAQPFPGAAQPAIPAQPVTPNAQTGTTQLGSPPTGTDTGSSSQTGTNPNTTTFGNTAPGGNFYTNDGSNTSRGFGQGNVQSGNNNSDTAVRKPATNDSTNGTNANAANANAANANGTNANKTNANGANANSTTNASQLSTDALLRGLADIKLSNLSNLNGGDVVNINTAWNNVQVQALQQSLKANAGASSNALAMTQLLQQRSLLSRDQFVVGFMGGKVYVATSGSSTTGSTASR